MTAPGGVGPVAPERSVLRRVAGVDLVVVLVLALIGAWVRASPLGPSSLWLDDAWLALASKAESLGELVTVGVTAPGFAAALAGVVGIVCFSSLSAQALPFAFGVAAAPVLYLVARRMGMGRGAALVGAALMLAAPVHIAYSSRVKPFTADAVLGLVVLLCGWRVVERPGEARRWTWLALVAVGSVMVSAAVAASVAGAYLAGLVAAGLRRPRRLTPAMWSTAGFAAFALGWWLAIVRPASTPSLRAYWADHYLDLGAGFGAAISDLATAVTNLVEGFSGLPFMVVGPVVAVCVAVVAARRPLVGVLLVTPLVVAVALAALEMAPLGGGRTDIHLCPSLALLVALGFHLATARLPLRPPWASRGVIAAVIAVIAVIAATLRPAPPYPQEDLRPLVAIVESSARPGDAIAVYSASRWGHALYTEGPVALRADPTSANGFIPVATDPRVTVLGPHREVPSRYEPEVEALSAGHDRVWLLSSHTRADVAVLEQYLRDRGFEATRNEHRPGASLTLWTRGEASTGR